MSADQSPTPTQGVDLTGKVVVVAGAAGAAGPPLVAALAQAGAHVVAVDRSQELLDPVVAAAGPNAVAAVVDLLDESAVRELAQHVRDKHGHVDGLIHLVGGWRGGAGIVESDLADWAWLHDLLIVTLQHTTRAFHDALRDSGGRVAIVSTVQAQAPTATNASYAAAKAAAEAWLLAVADSFGDSGAAATIVQVKALLTDQMRADRPDRKFPGYTHVDDLARHLTTLWDTPADRLNGTRESLVG